MLILWICVVIAVGVFSAHDLFDRHVPEVTGRRSRQVRLTARPPEIVWTIIPAFILIAHGDPGGRTLDQDRRHAGHAS